MSKQQFFFRKTIDKEQNAPLPECVWVECPHYDLVNGKCGYLRFSVEVNRLEGNEIVEKTVMRRCATMKECDEFVEYLKETINEPEDKVSFTIVEEEMKQCQKR